jgi:hypothetical protein
MGLAAPWFLAGLALLGLPVWLHLLRRHRSPPLRFSSVMLLESTPDRSVRQRRLDHILLLALRLLLLGLLVLAFAQPFFTRSVAAAGRLRLVVIDQSASMGAGRRLEDAKNEAQAFIARMGKGERTQVAALSSRLKLLSQPEASTETLRAAVAQLRTTDSRSSYGELVRSAGALVEAEHLPIEIHLFSDMQKSSMPARFKDLALPENVSLVTYPVVKSDEPNWTVESVSAPRRLGDPKKTRIEATIAGFHTEAKTLEARLVLNGRTVATKSVAVPASGRAGVEFLGLDAPYGLDRCEVRVDAKDPMTADDVFYFAVERSDPKKVLFAAGPRGAKARVYLDAALGAAAESAYSIDTVPSAELTGIDPKKYAFIVLSDPGPLDAAWETRLKSAVEDGLGVWVIAGPSMAARGKVPLTGDKVKEARYASREGERFVSVTDADDTFPALAGSGKWDGVRFFQTELIDAEGARVAAKLSDGVPVLYERRIGAGKVVVLASALDNVANDLPLRPVFVAFVGQLSDYLSGVRDGASSQVVDGNLELRCGAAPSGSTAEVLGPNGERALSLEESTRAKSVPLEQAGFYELRRAGGRREMVSVNIDRRESDLERMPEESLALWQGKPQSAPAQKSGAEMPVSRQVVSWPLLLAALLVAVTESVVAGRHLSLGA